VASVSLTMLHLKPMSGDYSWQVMHICWRWIVIYSLHRCASWTRVQTIKHLH